MLICIGFPSKDLDERKCASEKLRPYNILTTPVARILNAHPGHRHQSQYSVKGDQYWTNINKQSFLLTTTIKQKRSKPETKQNKKNTQTNKQINKQTNNKTAPQCNSHFFEQQIYSSLLAYIVLRHLVQPLKPEVKQTESKI